jgi:hypothetical protein
MEMMTNLVKELVTMSNNRKHRIGELRPSQMLYTFGVGSIVELPRLAVLIKGLNFWDLQDSSPIPEERLLAIINRRLASSQDRKKRVQIKKLCQPPLPKSETGRVRMQDDDAKIGVPVIPFSRWFVCSKCNLLTTSDTSNFERKTDPRRPMDTYYEHKNCGNLGKAPIVYPARFLVACSKGHLDEFPWHYFVHQGKVDCLGPLELEGSQISPEYTIKCQGCKKQRSLIQAFGKIGQQSFPSCRGRHPQLETFDTEICEEKLKTVLLGASDAWFPVTLGVISLPDDTGAAKRVNPLVDVVAKHWAELGLADFEHQEEFIEEFHLERRRKHWPEDLRYCSLNDVWQAMQEYRQTQAEITTLEEESQPLPIKLPEWRVLSAANTTNAEVLQLRQVDVPPQYERELEKVVLVERLREVRALLGFTRLESPYDYLEEEDSELPYIAPLSKDNRTDWLPGSEVFGEGIFIQFREDTLSAWETSRDDYYQKLRKAYNDWRRERLLKDEYSEVPMRYVLLHSFAHALIRQLAIACGYTAASLRERIYAQRATDQSEAMAGILIYTASSDSEGTLGGLVSLGEPAVLARHISQALARLKWCTSDPLCAEHEAWQEPLSLHMAACHACLFSAETSCERGNKFLDRSLLVNTVKNAVDPSKSNSIFFAKIE